MAFSRWGRPNKYNNTKVHRSGRRFDSKLEAAVFDLLIAQQAAGEISEVFQQPTIYVSEARIGMRPDFRCTLPTGEIYFVEAKGMPTQEWLIKLKLYRVYGPAPLYIYEGTYKKPYLKEVVVPKLFVNTELNFKEES